jgi:hypothetical protein
MLTASIADTEFAQLGEHLRSCAPAEHPGSIRDHFRVVAH